jgi:zinc carboxypeptidase
MNRHLQLRLLIGLLAWITAPPAVSFPKNPLEQNGYTRLATSGEISDFLKQLIAHSPLVRGRVLGRSVLGRPIDALFLAQDPDSLAEGLVSPHRLTLLLVGAQHGSERAGADALLLVARDLLVGPLRPLLQGIEVIIVPNANPDGREADRYTNIQGVNLNDDFTLVSQPESRALNDALLRWRPEVVLDVHESPVLKKSPIGREGYLIDFEAQMEVANNPNVDPEILALSRHCLLPQWVDRMRAHGLPARHYIGAITRIAQPISHGRLWLRNLRNKAGFFGAFSFLIENRIDAPQGRHPDSDLIQKRVAKHVLSIETWMQMVHRHQEAILRIAHRAQAPAFNPIRLFHVYALDAAHPRLTLTLRKRATGEPVAVHFADHRAVKTGHHLALPKAYVVTAHQTVIKEWLERNRITYRMVHAPWTRKVKAQWLGPGAPPSEPHDNRLRGQCDPAVTVASEREVELTIREGALWIDLDQSQGRLVPLLLDPRSSSRIFTASPYCGLLVTGNEFFIYRIER